MTKTEAEILKCATLKAAGLTAAAITVLALAIVLVVFVPFGGALTLLLGTASAFGAAALGAKGWKCGEVGRSFVELGYGLVASCFLAAITFYVVHYFCPDPSIPSDNFLSVIFGAVIGMAGSTAFIALRDSLVPGCRSAKTVITEE